MCDALPKRSEAQPPLTVGDTDGQDGRQRPRFLPRPHLSAPPQHGDNLRQHLSGIMVSVYLLDP